MMEFVPQTVSEVQDAVREATRVHVSAGGTKTALADSESVALNLCALRGVQSYTPDEFTFTAGAGTPLAEVHALLSEHGQYLPFDPPWAARGATLGGTLAVGLSGPGRYRYGGVRDFILGVRFVDGAGTLVRGGGQVVKNAAGFDWPKFMVGSLGRFAVLVELTFKVFPQSPAHCTVQAPFADVMEARAAMERVYTARLDVAALDFSPHATGAATVWVRLGGLPEALPARAERVRALLNGGEVLTDTADENLWHSLRDVTWCPADWALLKVPLTPRRIPEVLAAFPTAMHHYSCGGNVAWLAFSEVPNTFDATLQSLQLSALRVLGAPGPTRYGLHRAAAFERRVKQVLDPDNRFGVIP